MFVKIKSLQFQNGSLKRAYKLNTFRKVVANLNCCKRSMVFRARTFIQMAFNRTDPVKYSKGILNFGILIVSNKFLDNKKGINA